MSEVLRGALPPAPPDCPGWQALRGELLAQLDRELSCREVDELRAELQAWALAVARERADPSLELAAAAQSVALSWAGEGSHFVSAAEGGPCLIQSMPRRGLRESVEQRAMDELLRPLLWEGGGELGELGQLRSRLEGARELALSLAEPLVALEEARGALWRKPKLVASAEWCLCLELVPRELWAEILVCPAQRREWQDLFGVELPADEAGALVRLAEEPRLVVDTTHLPRELKWRLLESQRDLDALCQGIYLVGDNAHALRLLEPRFRERVQCVYIDPPFNARTSYAYEDRLESHVWLCFMEERLGLAKQLLRPDGTLFAHIDYYEKERFKLLLDRHLHYVTEIIWRIGWLSGFKTRAHKFIRNHDTIYHYGRSPKPLFVKRYLPYPEGYVRRDGKPPTGQGYPLEDTWNCSALDRLDSILIKSFSREKVGSGLLTQKNEELLERMLYASSRVGDLVLDYFAGSGTTCAVAHKMGRRWLGVEAGPEQVTTSLSRLKRVLYGDRYGISSKLGWQGGGAFQVVRLETFPEACAAWREDSDAGTLSYRYSQGSLQLAGDPWSDPFDCRLAGTGQAVDLVESFNWLLGLSVKQVHRVGEVLAVCARDRAGRRVLVLWGHLGEALLSLATPLLEGREADGGTIFTLGSAGQDELEQRWPTWARDTIPAAWQRVLLSNS